MRSCFNSAIWSVVELYVGENLAALPGQRVRDSVELLARAPAGR